MITAQFWKFLQRKQSVKSQTDIQNTTNTELAMFGRGQEDPQICRKLLNRMEYKMKIHNSIVQISIMQIGTFPRSIYSSVMIQLLLDITLFMGVCYNNMTKSNAAEAVKPIMILTSASVLFAVGLVVILAATGDQGFGVTYIPKTVCNTYLKMKYQTLPQTGYKVRFILTVISAICLGVQVGYFIKAYFRIGDISSLKISDIIVWSQFELILIYLGYSLSLLSIIPLMSFYISILAEQGRCLDEINGKQISICILSIILFLMVLVCWILIVINYDTASNQRKQNLHQSIVHNDLKEREMEMRNMFEDSQSNKPFKYNNKQDLKASLLVQNEPIPLFQSTNDKREQFRNYNNQQHSLPFQANKFGQFLMESPRKKNPKKTVDKQKLATLQKIDQKKRRFREMNPFKVNQGINPNQVNEQSIEEVVELPDEENRMRNLPKQYIQYIREAKKVKRLPPNIQEIREMIRKNEKKNPKELEDDQKKKQRIKDKINQIKQQLMRKMEGQKKVQERELQFIEENEQIIEQKIKTTQFVEQNEELFYYRPRMQKGKAKRKTKSLFENEAYELAQLQTEQEGQNKLIINKLKDKNPSKHKSIEPLVNLMKVQQKKENKTKQDLMIEFLRKKYLQQQLPPAQQVYSGFPVQ